MKKSTVVKTAVAPVVSLKAVKPSTHEFTKFLSLMKDLTTSDSTEFIASASDTPTLVLHNMIKNAPFVYRKTGYKVDLMNYGRKGTFTLALAQKLATTGLNEDEYKKIAKKHDANEKRFLDYIRFYKKEGFEIIMKDNRYMQAA